jgi:hypothetical protein
VGVGSEQNLNTTKLTTFQDSVNLSRCQSTLLHPRTKNETLVCLLLPRISFEKFFCAYPLMKDELKDEAEKVVFSSEMATALVEV